MDWKVTFSGHSTQEDIFNCGVLVLKVLLLRLLSLFGFFILFFINQFIKSHLAGDEPRFLATSASCLTYREEFGNLLLEMTSNCIGFL